MIKYLIKKFLNFINEYNKYNRKILELQSIIGKPNLRILKMINKLPKKYRGEAIMKAYKEVLHGWDIKDITLEVKIKNKGIKT